MRSLVLILIRTKEDGTDSSIALERPSMNSERCRRLSLSCRKSLALRYIDSLQRRRIPPDLQESEAMLAVILPYAESIALQSCVDFQRQLAPRGLPRNDDRYDDTMLDDRLVSLIATSRNLEKILGNCSQKRIAESQYLLDTEKRLRTVLTTLGIVEEDLIRLRAHYVENQQSMDSSIARDLMSEQKEETRESKETAISVGKLTTLATVFLPLGVTTSLLGMNLQLFGTGTISLSTFVLSALAAYTFAALPFLGDLLSFVLGTRISAVIDLASYSPWAALIFGFFCLFHSRKLNNDLWGCGIRYDIDFFQHRVRKPRDKNGDGWKLSRRELKDALNKRSRWFYEKFWSAKLDELFLFIDTPGWEKRSSLRNYFASARYEGDPGRTA